MNASMARRNSIVLVVLSPRSALRDRIPNQISTWFNQLAEVGVNIGMFGEPLITLFVCTVIVQDDMHFLVGLGFGHYLVHKLQEFLPPFELSDRGSDFPGCHFQGCKEV